MDYNKKVVMTDGMNDAKCYICFDKKTCKSTCCNVCNKSICIDCYIKLIGIDYEKYEIEKENVYFSMKCPVCRNEDSRHRPDNFTKKELVKLCYFLMLEHSKDWRIITNKFQKYKKQYDNLSEIANRRGIMPQQYGLPSKLDIGINESIEIISQ